MDKRIIEQFNKRAPFKLEDAITIVLAQIGSHSHGTYMSPSDPQAIDDVDYMGIVIPPLDFTLGLEDWEGANFQFEELDCVFYSFKKFMNLLVKSNPNVIGLLWLREECYIEQSREWSFVLDHRNLFSTKKIRGSFLGYANAQLTKMTHFGSKFQGYMGAKRKALVEKYGYDTKNASHLIRLMRMCNEFLETGKLNVYRENDAKELIDIKQGKWTLEEVEHESLLLFNACDTAYDKSTLPYGPDMNRINALCRRVYRTAYHIQNQKQESTLTLADVKEYYD